MLALSKSPCTGIGERQTWGQYLCIRHSPPFNIKIKVQAPFLLKWNSSTFCSLFCTILWWEIINLKHVCKQLYCCISYHLQFVIIIHISIWFLLLSLVKYLFINFGFKKSEICGIICVIVTYHVHVSCFMYSSFSDFILFLPLCSPLFHILLLSMLSELNRFLFYFDQ